MRTERAMTAGVLLAAGILLAGCSGESADSEGTATPSPSASSAPASPTATPGAAAEADEAGLPVPAEDIASWADTAVPNSDTPEWAFSLSGWLSENTSAHEKNTYQSLEPGAYQAQIACRGEGQITVTAGEADGEAVSEPVACANETIAFDVTTTRTGVEVLFDLEGAPSIFAFSLVRAS